MTNKAENFGTRLRELLTQHNISQAQLAKATGLEESAISHFVSGRRLPSYENLMKLCDAFGDAYSKAYLVGL